MIKKKRLLFIPLAAVVLLIGTVAAIYVNTSSLKNPFQTSSGEVSVIEKFNPGNDWVPGEEKIKEVLFKNQGDTDTYLRFRPVVTFAGAELDGETTKDTDGTYTTVYSDINKRTVCSLNWSSAFAEYEQINGYYYYKRILETGTATSPVLKTVTVGDIFSNTGANTDASDIQVLIEGNMVQVSADAAEETWNMEVSGNTPSLIWKAKSSN